MQIDSANPITIMLTQGDPAGIGPEIVARAVAEWPRPADCRLVVVGYPAHFFEIWPRGKDMPHFVAVNEAMKLTPRPGVFWTQPDFGARNEPVELGKASARGGQAAARCVEVAIDYCLAEQADAICTAPISKEVLRAAGYAFPGHAELLAQRTSTDHYASMAVGGGLRVVLATGHEPLAKVPEMLGKRKLVDLFHLVHRSLPDFGVEEPRIAVAGLNPHAGEGGLYGREEIEIIEPAIAVVRGQGLNVAGPLPGDTIFHRMLGGEFDAVVAMHHDQGLAPVKTLAFRNCIDVTLGLPFIRTAPDHGTVYSLAGKGVACIDGILEALTSAYGQAVCRRDRRSQPSAF